jgi:putative ABC transport system ATP-binding protein
MSMLELRQVSKSYGSGDAEVHALAGVSLSVEAGAMVAVMGPSGSGKSTLLTIAGSLEEPTAGEVLVGGQSLSHMSRSGRARLRRRTIGYVFQDFNLLPGLTAAENVSLPLELDGTPARKARAAGLRALTELGLAERASRYPDQLSGGERQRVAIARALVVEPDLLVCDEVTSALDVSVQAVIVELLRRLQREHHLAMIFITHNLALVRSIAQSVVVLRDGAMVESGPVGQVLERPSDPYTIQLLRDVPRLAVAGDRGGDEPCR